MTNPTTDQIVAAFLAARASIVPVSYPTLALIDITTRGSSMQGAGSCVALFDGHTITRDSGSFLLTIKTGDTIAITGTASNNITTRVTNAAALVLTVSAALVTEGQITPVTASFSSVRLAGQVSGCNNP